MKSINEKLALLQAKMKTDTPVTIMIIGLGSVGVYLLDYLISLSDNLPPHLSCFVTDRE